MNALLIVYTVYNCLLVYHRDMETIMYELCRKDTAYVDSIRAKKEMDVKRDPKNKLPPVFFTVMDKVKEMLGETNSVRPYAIESVDSDVS